jgi:hypothetical protein
MWGMPVLGASANSPASLSKQLCQNSLCTLAAGKGVGSGTELGIVHGPRDECSMAMNIIVAMISIMAKVIPGSSAGNGPVFTHIYHIAVK